MSHQRSAPLLTVVVTDEGEIEVEPGESFGDEHVDMMVGVALAVQEYLNKHMN